MSDIPDHYTKAVVRQLHDKGIELTPDEVVSDRNKALTALRKKLRERGYNPPDSDMKLMALLKEILKR